MTFFTQVRMRVWRVVHLSALQTRKVFVNVVIFIEIGKLFGTMAIQ